MAFTPRYAALLWLACSPLADVLIVDDSGGGDFTYLQAAIDAAADGDVVLVRPGVYADFFLDGKGLVVVAEAPGTAILVGGAVVEDLAAGQRAVLSGLVIHGHPDALEQGLWVRRCAGPVRVEACALHGANGADYAAFPGGSEAAVVEDSTGVLFVASTLEAGSGGLVGAPCETPAAQLESGAALSISGSRVAVYDADLRGGQGSPTLGVCVRAGGGGPGLKAELSSWVMIAGSSLTGGQGGHVGATCSCGGDGGSALVLDGSAVDLLDVALLAGQPHPLSTSGVAGEEMQLSGGATVDAIPGSAPALIAPGAVASASAFALTVEGEPGDLAVLAASIHPGFLHLPALNGTLLLGLPLAVNGVALGALDPTGEKTLPLLAPALPLGLEHAAIHAQAVTVAPSGAITLTGSRTLVVLAPGLLP